MQSNQPAVEVSSKIAYLQPGLYLVRLVADAQGNVLTLYATPVGRGTVDFFPGDGVLRNTLAKAGDCIVVRVKGDLGTLLLTEFHKAGQQHRITIKIDRVAQEELGALPDEMTGGQARVPATVASVVATEVSALSIRLMGHIERVGDTTVQDDWLGDPQSDRRLEGFAVAPQGMPKGVSLNYGVLIEGAAHLASAVAGQFVGTRQKAKALVGVAFDLTGPQAQGFELSGAVVFAGEPPLAIEPGVLLAGPSGTEHLVAIQLSIEPKAARSTAASAWEDPAITKISRSSAVVGTRTRGRSSVAKKVAGKKDSR